MTSPLENYHTKNYLIENVIIVSPETSVMDIYQKMQSARIRHIPVVSNGEPVGIISDRDVKFVSYSNDVTQLQAKDIMSSDPFTAHVETPLRDVVRTMSKKKIGSCIILDEHHKVGGIFTSSDALQILADIFPREN